MKTEAKANLRGDYSHAAPDYTVAQDWPAYTEAEHALFRRLRDEAPLYYSEQHDFYAVSRFEDIERTLLDRETFISRKGVTLDLLKGQFDIPPGTLIFDGVAGVR